MSHRMARLAAVGLLAVLLTGCIKLNVDFDVSSDNTVSGTMVFAFSKQLLQLTGQSAQELIGSSAPIPSSVPGVSAKAYDDGDFVGEEFTFDGVPLTQFNADDPESLSIVRHGDTFTVSGVLDLSGGAGASGATSSIPGINQALGGADIRISITFPGSVTDTNGTVDGTTVTWKPQVGQRLELRATAGATGSGSSSTSSIVLIVGIALVVIVAIALFMNGRRKGTVDDAAAGMPPMVPSEAPAMQAPPTMPQPPPAPPAAPTTEAVPPEETPPPPGS
ncbi:MAG: hypothetical protein ABI879_05830 [Actinomycetota bacterium]